MTLVLDASALLAYLHQESGWEKVRAVIGESYIGAVNWSEVAQKTRQIVQDLEAALAQFREIAIDLGAEDAAASGFIA